MRPGPARFQKHFMAGTLLAFAFPIAGSCLPVQGPDLGQTRSVAEAQHEIVVILIKKKEFAKAAEEANKIFKMKWPDGEEPVLLKELLGFSDEFRHNKQHEIALRLLDSNMNAFKAPRHKAAIWKDKGYIYKEMGQPDKALECFREAQRLEMGKNSPN